MPWRRKKNRIEITATTPQGVDVSIPIPKVRSSSDQVLVLEDLRESQADYSGGRYAAVSVTNCHFTNCKFEKLRVDSACFGSTQAESTYTECSFDGSKIKDATVVGRARFERCTFRNVLLKEWFSLEAEYIGCVFSGKMEKAVFDAEPPESDLYPRLRKRNEILDNDFSGMDLVDVDFRGGIDLTRNKMPEGPQYLCLPDVKAAIMVLENLMKENLLPDVIDEARIQRNMFKRDLERGQTQAFLDIQSLARGKRAKAATVMFEALKASVGP